MPHPAVSSLQATWVPVPHTACRTYSTVSSVVCVELQVSIVAVPDTDGVHW